ncbi:MAG: hypothetical protein R2941_00680 [Desulfobacterales bacterium]
MEFQDFRGYRRRYVLVLSQLRQRLFSCPPCFSVHRRRADVPGLPCCRGSGVPNRIWAQKAKVFPIVFAAPPCQSACNSIPQSVFLREETAAMHRFPLSKDSFNKQADCVFISRTDTRLILQKSRYLHH